MFRHAFWLALVALSSAGQKQREKRFLGEHWWKQFHSGVDQLESRTTDTSDNLSSWARKVEEEMRPAIDKFGTELGGLLGGIMDTLVLDNPLFQHSLVDRQDGVSVISGDNSSGLDSGIFSASFSSSSSSGDMAKFGQEMNKFSQAMGKWGSRFGEEMSGVGIERVGSHLSPLDPFSLFGFVRRPWYKGENICEEREVTDEGDEVNSSGFGAFAMNMRMTSCREEKDAHECTTTVSDGGIKKTVVVRHVCCHGYKRDLSNRGHCSEFSMKSLVDTVSDVGGSEFLVLLEDNNMIEKLVEGNMTVFVPTNEAIDDFHEDLIELNKVDLDDDTYNIDDGLTSRRKKRDFTVTETPRLQDILLAHMTEGFVSTNDMADESLLSTMMGDKIRMTVYNTFPKKVVMANCARIVSRDNMATNGLVHMVDKVIVPAKHNIMTLLSEDLGLSQFSLALEKAGLADKLSSDGQFTVFAPTDRAFDKLESSVRDKLIGGGGCGLDILRHHILPNVICSGIVEGKVKTNNMADRLLTLSQDEEGNLLVDGFKVKMRDMAAKNGIVHVIEDVIVPESARSVVDALESMGRKTLVELFKSAKMTEMKEMTNMTIFAPSEKALSELPEEFLTELKNDPAQLREFLMYHMAETGPEINNNMMINTKLPEQQIRVNTYGSLNILLGSRGLVTTAQCAKIDKTEEEVCGGSVHSVDKVLVPPSGTIEDLIINSEEYNMFNKLMEFSEIELGEDVTVLVPTDGAFDKLDKEVQDRLFDDKEFALQVAKKHVLPEVLCCAGIQRTNILFHNNRKRTIGGDVVSVKRSNSGHLYADHAPLSKCDIMATNGVIHQVESLVSLPSEDTAQERMDTFTKLFPFNPFKLF